MRAHLLVTNARFVLTVDEQSQVLHNSSIAVVDGRIAEIGSADDMAARWTADQTIDASHALVMPGLVNLHTHTPMTLLRGVAENVDLQGFLERVWAEEARIMDPEGTYIGARLGALEALLAGTTTALDMYFHPAAAHKGAVEVGLRHIIGPVFFDFPGPDGLEWSQRMHLAHAWPNVVAEIGGPYVPLALMPHCPLTVNPEHLAELTQWARESGSIITTHTSENLAENRDTIAAHGERPTALLQSSGMLALKPVLAHGVQLSDEDQHLIARAGASVAHCPGSNLKLASGAADIVRYRNEGITVGLGTDGCSSSNDLDMFSVMRLSANLARLVRENPAAIGAAEIVRAATIDGARALGMDDRIGSLEPGKEADFIVLNLESPHLIPVHDPHTAVVFSAGRSDVQHVVVAGEVVIRDRQPTRVTSHDVMDAAKQHVGASA